MEQKIQNFKDLKIWQKGMEIVKDVYRLTETFPSKEIYGLVSQMRRASISLPSNIAEGFKRYHNKEFKQFLHIMLGSAAELETQLLIAQELEYVKEEQVSEICLKLDYLSRMTTTLMRKFN